MAQHRAEENEFPSPRRDVGITDIDEPASHVGPAAEAATTDPPGSLPPEHLRVREGLVRQARDGSAPAHAVTTPSETAVDDEPVVDGKAAEEPAARAGSASSEDSDDGPVVGETSEVAEDAAARDGSAAREDADADTAAADGTGADPDDDDAAAEEQPEDDSEQSESQSLRGALRQLLRHIRKLRGSLLIALALLVLASVVGLAQPIATQLILTALTDGTSLAGPVLILLGCVLGAALAQGSGQFLILRVAEGIVAGTRSSMVRQILGMSVRAMHKRDPGDLMSRVISDSSSVRQIALQSVVQAVTGTVVVVGSVVLMVILDWMLFLITFGVVAVLCLGLLFTMPKIRKYSQQTQANIGRLSTELERSLGSFTTVKASGAVDDEVERVDTTIGKARRSGVRTAIWTAASGMLSALTVQAAFLVVLAVGSLRVQSGLMTIPTLIAFLLYAMQLSAPVLQLTAAFSAFQSGRAALERIGETETFEQEDDVETEGIDPAAVPGARNSLGPRGWKPAAEFEGVQFRYPDDAEPTLRGVDLHIGSKGLTALVGPSGSGKSTILRLLVGFYPVETGLVSVGGRVLGDWDLDELRDRVAYVEQETPVLAGTVHENLTYGQDDVDEADVEKALERTGLDERVDSLDEHVGHRGQTFSGGERQRISIARALLRQPDLLLLDEVTSQLDPRTEKSMLELVHEISGRIPVVMVAHRLSTVVDADEIVVMENGAVRARGSHQELIRDDELYRQMVQQQGLLSDEEEAATAGAPA